MSTATGIHAYFRLDYPGFALAVDLALPGRGVTAVFGRSGSGKTTLLRAIAGLERVRDGRLTVNGACWQDERVFRPPHRRPVGYVFQDANLFPHLSVQANLEYGQKRVPAAQRRISLDQAVTLLNIGPLLKRTPDRLSGGERQRVAIARALAVSPNLLLMDEPLAALDHALKQDILPYLERLHDDLDIPLLYVSHAPDEVARLADHLVVLDAGRVVAAGPLTDTLARLDLPIRLGEDAGVVLDAVVAARDSHWQLAHLAFAGGRLWVRDEGLAVGHGARVRILARDVSLALAPVEGTSILNTLAATVEASAADAHPALMLVKLRVGDSALLARVTRRSAENLALAPGRVLYAQIKAVALIG
jgi:molybdate transport system ATP-binding protein